MPAVAALLVAPFLELGDLGGVLNFMLVAAVIVGLPLAAIAALADAVETIAARSTDAADSPGGDTAGPRGERHDPCGRRRVA